MWLHSPLPTHLLHPGIGQAAKEPPWCPFTSGDVGFLSNLPQLPGPSECHHNSPGLPGPEWSGWGRRLADDEVALCRGSRGRDFGTAQTVALKATSPSPGPSISTLLDLCQEIGFRKGARICCATATNLTLPELSYILCHFPPPWLFSLTFILLGSWNSACKDTLILHPESSWGTEWEKYTNKPLIMGVASTMTPLTATEKLGVKEAFQGWVGGRNYCLVQFHILTRHPTNLS